MDLKNEDKSDSFISSVATTKLGSAVCETVLPSVPLQPLDIIEKSIKKNIVQNFGRHLFVD